MMTSISILVEGNLDETVARKIIEAEGAMVGNVYGRKGVSYIEKKIKGFNGYAQGTPILTLVITLAIFGGHEAQKETTARLWK